MHKSFGAASGTDGRGVVFASDLPPCPCCGEEPFCELHGQHYADCPCIGPDSEPDE